MSDIIQETISNPDTLWLSVEALSTLVTAIIAVIGFYYLKPQLKRWREESATHIVEGLQFASEQIQAPDFQHWRSLIESEWKGDSENYPEYLTAEIVSILARLDWIATLIDIRFINRELLFKNFSYQFSNIASVLINFQSKKGSRLESSKAMYPKGYKLLMDGKDWHSEEIQKGFARVD